MTFEDILRQVESLPRPQSDELRQVFWCDADKRVGVSRQHLGGREVFIRGSKLRGVSALVQRHLKFDSWASAENERFEANRVVFPVDEYYIPLIVLVVERLQRNLEGGENAEKAFLSVEPILELILRRLALGDQTVLGLLGELKFLDALLNATANDVRKATRVIDCWHGHAWSARDFVFENCSVEVKATRGTTSTHHIHSIMQVDPRRTTEGMPREQLYLLSMGFELVESECEDRKSLTLPEQVESLRRKCLALVSQPAADALGALLLDKIGQYGHAAEGGYQHGEMSDWPAYQMAWRHTFTRIYDMGDPSIFIIRREDVRGKAHVTPESVQFELSLPERIAGDLNPQIDLGEFAGRIVQEM